MARWDTYTNEMRVKTFIEKAVAVHGNKYDYSLVTAEQLKNKSVTIICPKHGKFEQNPSNHIHNHGCRLCAAEVTGSINKIKKTGVTPSNKVYTKDFIEKAMFVHGTKFSYENTNYEYARKQITVTCCACHKDFKCFSTDFLKPDFECPHCKKRRKQEETRKIKAAEFLAKAKEIHNDKYDYSKVNYVDSHTKVCIICPEHGEFMQSPTKHLAGQGCKLCSHPNEGMTKEEFIKKANEVHGEKYDYSEVEYVNATTKVKIICHEKDICGKEHGAFFQTPHEHINGGRGCAKCRCRYYDKETFIKLAQIIHKGKYDYSKVEFVNTQTPVTIICHEKDKFGREHGEFCQTPESHISGRGCTKCVRPNQGLTTEDFIFQAQKKHGTRYDYSRVKVANMKTPVEIICAEHGSFWQTPESHLNGSGCPICNVGYTKDYKLNLLEEFKSEFAFREFLMTNDENMIYIILRNIEKIEPKFNPIVKDIDKVLRSGSIDPIKDLEDKYRKPEEEDTKEGNTTATSETEATAALSINDVDLDDDEAVESFIETTTTEKKDDKKEPTIEDLTKARETEIKVINKIEHMLTPEDLYFIKTKFLNDKRREWMLNRDRN